MTTKNSILSIENTFDIIVCGLESERISRTFSISFQMMSIKDSFIPSNILEGFRDAYAGDFCRELDSGNLCRHLSRDNDLVSCEHGKIGLDLLIGFPKVAALVLREAHGLKAVEKES